MRIINAILLRLLYLTPIGYLISLFNLQLGNYTPGVFVRLSREYPIKAIIKSNPTYNDKRTWISNGLFLLIQAVVVVVNKAGGGLGLTYAWIASIFGLVSLVSAINPKFQWNRKFPLVGITTLELLVIVTLLLISGYFTAPDSVLESLNLR